MPGIYSKIPSYDSSLNGYEIIIASISEDEINSSAGRCSGICVLVDDPVGDGNHDQSLCFSEGVGLAAVKKTYPSMVEDDRHVDLT